MTPFFQSPPVLENAYRADTALQRILLRHLGPDELASFEPDLARMGEMAVEAMLTLGARYRRDEPVHTPVDPWGRRIDAVSVSGAWEAYKQVAAETGLVRLPYSGVAGARMRQMALVYLFAPSSKVYTCPLAMSDGCATVLTGLAGTYPAADRAAATWLPRLTHQDGSQAALAGQWMTERTGGSDVGLTRTSARHREGQWLLSGNKWFTSAISADVALTLARPEGNPAGGRGLALFLVALRQADGTFNGIRVDRLKDKLGTRHVPTAELELQHTKATLLATPSDGVRHMAPMLNVTRLWNSVCAAASMRRGLMLAQDYAERRVAFGAVLRDQPLHAETLATLAAQSEAALHLVFHAVERMDASAGGGLDAPQKSGIRALFALTKLVTAKMAVAHASECLEAFGGAGYVEDTGLPEMLRDAQVFPIWEGTTNVLSLELCRGLRGEDALDALVAPVDAVSGDDIAAQEARRLVAAARCWWRETEDRPVAREAGARYFALHLGQALMLALLLNHADWERDPRLAAATRANAERLAALGVSPALPRSGQAPTTHVLG